MKKEFSKAWIGSRQTRKQRKYRANAGTNTKRKLMSANLSEELKKKYQRKSFTVRTGDKVKVMAGEFKGKEGKLSLVDMRKMKVAIEGIQLTKKDGTKINSMFDSSKLQIQELNLTDKKREESLKNKNKTAEVKK